MPPTLLQSIPIDGPGDRHVRVLFYDDGSVRIRIANAGPMKLSEAFLRGKGEHVIVKLDPEVALHSEGRSLLVREPEDERAETIELLQAKNFIALAERAKRIGDRLTYESAKFRDAHQTDAANWGILVETAAQADTVATAVFRELGGRMHEFIALGAAVIQYEPGQAGPLGQSLFRAFRSEGAESVQMLQAVPRFVSSITTQVLLGYALALRQYEAFTLIGKPRAVGIGLGAPWITTWLFHHLRTVGGSALYGGRAAMQFAESEAHEDVNLSILDLKSGIIGAGLLAAICARAQMPLEDTPDAWSFRFRLDGIEPMLRELATDDAACEPIAATAGESVAAFRAAFRHRHDELLELMGRSPLGLRPDLYGVSDETLALFDRAPGR